MIQITLNFTSIEAARAALLEIPESSLVAGATPAKVEAPKPVKAEARAATQSAPATATTTPKASAKAETAAESPSEGKPAAAATPAAQPASSPKPSDSVDYPTLQKAVFALAGKSREAAAAVAGSFGVKTFKELPEAKWAEALAAVTAKLSELEAA